MAYVRLLYSHALGETKKHWTPQKMWAAFASPVVTVPIRGLFYGWTMKDLGFTAAITIFVVAVAWGLTFLFELTRAPALIHNQQQIAIQALSKTRTGAGVHHSRLAKTGTDQIGPTGRDVLRHLWIHERLTFGAHPPPPSIGHKHERYAGPTQRSGETATRHKQGGSIFGRVGENL